jgi:hypothetical protein
VSTQPPDQPSGEAVPLPDQEQNPVNTPDYSGEAVPLSDQDPGMLEYAPNPSSEAVPRTELDPMSSPYMPSPEVEALTPRTPEVLAVPVVPWSSDDPTLPSSSLSIPDTMIVVPPPAGAPEGVGGILLSTDALLDEEKARSLSDAFGTATLPRVSSRELFRPEDSQQPDTALLKQFVTTQRIRDLWNQMDALQEEIIQNVRADRSSTDTYQQDLLYASSLLLQAPANYDEARQIVYRVRADLNRERRILLDITRYRPAILAYYGVWLIVTIIATQFDTQFREMVPENVSILRLAFLPILFAIFGSLVNGVMALNDHMTVKRDFDPIYFTWYLLNPVIGGLLGLVVFILFVVTGSSFTPNLLSNQSASTQQTPVIWLLAFVIGWQQNTAVRLLNGFLKTVSSSSESVATTDRPSATGSGTTTTTPKK